MPGANEVLGCLRKYFLFVPQNCWQPFFSRSPNCLVIYPNFIFFALAVKFYENSLLGCPPLVLHHVPVRTFFSFFWSFTYIFLTKTGPLDAPPGWMPGAVAPSAPPLHATGQNTDRIRSMLKKGHEKILALKWKFSPKKVTGKVGLWNSFSAPPQTRRQVSAHGRGVVLKT